MSKVVFVFVLGLIEILIISHRLLGAHGPLTEQISQLAKALPF